MGKEPSKGLSALSAGCLVCCVLAGLTAAVIAGSLVFRDLCSYGQAREEYTQLQTSYIMEDVNRGIIDDRTAEEKQYPLLEIDFAQLQQINPDLVGILCVPSLELCYPVVQGKTDTEYLKKTFYGTENSSGCIFMDTATSTDLSDMNTFLFGHNMKDGSMFGSLKRLYQEEDLCREDPYLYFYTEKTVHRYEIFSYYETDADSDAYQGIEDRTGYEAYVQQAKSRSLYVPESSTDCAKEMPEILTLSTCNGAAGGNRRFLVHGFNCGEYPL